MTIDWNNFPHNDLPRAKSLARQFYKSIGLVKCPALDDEYIAFTNKGWAHLIYKPTRNVTEITERLELLQYAELIISDPFAQIKHRLIKEKEKIKKGNERKLFEVDVHYWAFEKTAGGKSIKLVIRQIEQRQKYFYSIMLTGNL